MSCRLPAVALRGLAMLSLAALGCSASSTHGRDGANADGGLPATEGGATAGDGRAATDRGRSDGSKTESDATPSGYHPGNDGKCRFARATNYPIARANSVPQGTCSFGPVAGEMPQLFRDGYVSAPNEFFYNKTPGLAGACGECYELAGPLRTFTVMAADICDVACCENCRGDVVAFDVEQAHWEELVDQPGGNVSVAYRSVPCPVVGNIKAYFTSGYQAGDRFRLVIYNHRLGVRAVEVKGAPAKATKGEWTALPRTLDNYFDWTARGDVGLPMTLRVTSVQGEVIEFPPLAQLSSDLRITANGQFADKLAAGSPCVWPGPEPWIFRDKLEGILGLEWRDWGSYRLAAGMPDYAAQSGCHSGTRCIAVGAVGDWGAIQLGYPNFFPPELFAGIELYARTTSGTTSAMKLFVVGKDAAGADSTVSDKVALGAITTTWQKFFVPMSALGHKVSRMRVVQLSNQANTASPALLLDDLRLVRP